MIAAAIGGTASEISGGKFANGAITGAFSQALNNEQHERGLAKRIAQLKVEGFEVARNVTIDVPFEGKMVRSIADFIALMRPT